MGGGEHEEEEEYNTRINKEMSGKSILWNF